MTGIAAVKQRKTDRIGVGADEILIGKDLIEILTAGMYVSPLSIYREYIQNAADSIDVARSEGTVGRDEPGRVTIDFDQGARSVTIRDNGAGIARRDAVRILLAMGGSSKRGTAARGFRGVGRLSGLAYCRELEFRTKAAGESSIVSVTWDCRALRERLADQSFGGDLRRIISDVVSVWFETAPDPSDHFFEVRLVEVGRHRNDMLLNEALVAQYLGQVAPLAFHPDFSFGKLIEDRLAAHRRTVPLDLTVAGTVIHRPHRDEVRFPGSPHTLNISDIEFVELADVDGKTGALVWIAHHQYVKSLPVAFGTRGLRARFGDLQVGEASLFEDTFREPRFNNWAIGEIHIFDQRIMPNARRDNFELNHHYYNLLIQLGPVGSNITHRCRLSSASRNSAQSIQNVIVETDSKLGESRAFDPAELSRLRSSVLRAQQQLRRVANEVRREELTSELRRLDKALSDRKPTAGAAAIAFDDALKFIGQVVTNRDQRARLENLFRKVCL